MLKASLGLLLIVGTALPATAQDLQPALDPSVIAQGQVIAGTHRGYAERNSRSSRSSFRRDGGLTPQAIATCRNKRRAGANLGRDHPDVRQLYQLCARAGY